MNTDKRTYYFLECETCGIPSQTPGTHSEYYARKFATRNGWQQIDGRDLCPACAEKEKEGE